MAFAVLLASAGWTTGARADDAAAAAVDGVLPIPTAHSTSAPPSAGPLDAVAQRPLFADLPWRKRLADEGVTLTAHLIWEPAWVDKGYKGSGWATAQQVDIGAVLDLNKLGWSDQGTVKIILSDRTGRAIQQDKTGAYIQNQAYWGQGQNFRFNELSFERTLIDPRLSLKLGFYAMGNDFLGLSYVCNFNNNGNCGHPLGPLYGSNWLDNPTGQWGLRLKWTDPKGWYVQAGAYDVDPTRKANENGFKLSVKDVKGAILPLEVGYVRGHTAYDYAGVYKAGIYYDTSKASEIGRPGRTERGRYGGYVEAAQQIWKVQPGQLRGLSVFGVATWNDQLTGLFRTTFEAGGSFRGPFAARPDDIVSLSWVDLNLNNRLQNAEASAGKPAQTHEQMIELNYGWQAAPWLLVRPAVQYVMRPGGYASRPDTVAFTAHLQATF